MYFVHNEGVEKLQNLPTISLKYELKTLSTLKSKSAITFKLVIKFILAK